MDVVAQGARFGDSARAKIPKDSEVRVEHPVQEVSEVSHTADVQLQDAQLESSAKTRVELPAEPAV